MNNNTKCNHNMIINQVLTLGVNDKKILAAFEKNPKSRFLPRKIGSAIYSDNHLQIVKNVFETSTEIFALSLKFLSIKPTESVIEIGSSSLYHGYVIAALAHFVDVVPLKHSYLFTDMENLKNLSIETNKIEKKYDIAIINGCIEDYKPYLLYLEKNGKMIVYHKVKDLANGMALADLKIVYKDDQIYTEMRYGSYVMYYLGDLDE